MKVMLRRKCTCQTQDGSPLLLHDKEKAVIFHSLCVQDCSEDRSIVLIWQADPGNIGRSEMVQSCKVQLAVDICGTDCIAKCILHTCKIKGKELASIKQHTDRRIWRKFEKTIRVLCQKQQLEDCQCCPLTAAVILCSQILMLDADFEGNAFQL